MTIRGNQRRETLRESGYTLHGRPSIGTVTLRDSDGTIERWFANDNAACYVIEVDGVGYEFARTE